MSALKLSSIALDCANPQVLGQFWAELLDGEIGFASDNFVAVHVGEQWLTMMRVDGYRPPTWPTGEAPKQMHFDLGVADLDTSEALAVAAGAQRAEFQPAPDRFRVLLDPAGHPFCLTTQIP